MALATQGDLITAIQARGYTVAPSTAYPGFTDVRKGGVRTWSFLWGGIGRGDLACGATDANPNGLLVEMIGLDGVSGKCDVAQFVNSLN